MKKVLGVLAVAGLASSAMAQSFDGRLGFRDDHSTINDPNINGVYVYDASGQTDPVTLNFSITVGAFDAQGFTNYGLINWVGNIAGTGTGFSMAPATPASVAMRSPFNFNPVGDGDATADGQGITGIDVARNTALHQVLWFFGQPEPINPPVLPQGNNSYFQVYRFTVTLTDFSDRDIVISANGFSQVVSGWTHLGSNEPLDESTPGNVTWAGTSSVTDNDVGGTFILRIVPAPGAAALLGLGGLVAARRRRA